MAVCNGTQLTVKKNFVLSKPVLLALEARTYLTHSYLQTHKSIIGEQCRPRSDATECGVWSESTLFANRIFHQK